MARPRAEVGKVISGRGSRCLLAYPQSIRSIAGVCFRLWRRPLWVPGRLESEDDRGLEIKEKCPERQRSRSGWGGGSVSAEVVVDSSLTIAKMRHNPSNRSECEKKGACVVLNPVAQLTSYGEHLDQVNPRHFYVGCWMLVGGRKIRPFWDLKILQSHEPWCFLEKKNLTKQRILVGSENEDMALPILRRRAML